MPTNQQGFRREYLKHQKEIDKAIKRVLLSGRYILGKELEAFEKEFAKFLGFKYCVGVGNGYDALYLSLLVSERWKEAPFMIINELHVATTNACKYTNSLDISHAFNKSYPTTFILTGYRKIRDACREAHCFKKDNSDLVCFSFHPLKVLHCYGDGGAICTDNKELYKKLLVLRNHGRIGKSFRYTQGVNSRLDEIQAAILRVYLKLLKKGKI